MLISYKDIADFAWRSLQRGADHPQHPMHLVTMATVTPDARPAARLMVSRGVDRETGRLWFHTDVPSPKVADLLSHPSACIVAWDATSGVQLRLYGTATVHQDSALADEHWEQVSRAAIWLYGEPAPVENATGPVDLRLPRDKEQLIHKLTARERHQFAVVEIAVESIDWLQATSTERRRAHMVSAEGWRAVPNDA